MSQRVRKRRNENFAYHKNYRSKIEENFKEKNIYVKLAVCIEFVKLNKKKFYEENYFIFKIKGSL